MAEGIKIIYSDNEPQGDIPSVVKITTEELALRDWLAIGSIDAAYHHCRKTGNVEAKRVARYAYDLADALLEEKKKR